MFDKSDIQAAQEAGILSKDQANRLEAFLMARADPATPVATEGENLRFLNNFNDVFLTIGIVILAMGLTAVTGIFFGPQAFSIAAGANPSMAGAIILLPVAGVMWLLAEYFSRRRRMLLPSMALITIFTLYTGLSLGAIASGITGLNAETVKSFTGAWKTAGNMGIWGFLGCLGASTLAWWRFRLPFTLFLIALSVAGAAYTFFGFFGNMGYVIGGFASLLIGAATLLAGIWFDAKDPGRITRNADNAFWLNVAAAPQIIFGLRGMITGSTIGVPHGTEAFLMIACLVGLGILSIALNRRALIVSSLLAFWLSLGSIVQSLGWSSSYTFMISALLLGTGIVLLGGGWHTARRVVLAWMPKSGPLSRIFPPEPA